ncbi:hypothetical protein PoB_003904900 [Plakobranchus ocellatus]|uniref:RRM domain-containing protein n=1 Tax=Plakobranchus ocellatus TaxID=259542 RepID=A0AAV4AXP2_9GAST|nr:hypothetical protein PoB_003904900 [Plakobranchus ocellatus]
MCSYGYDFLIILCIFHISHAQETNKINSPDDPALSKSASQNSSITSELRRFLCGLDCQTYDGYRDPRIILSNERKKFPSEIVVDNARPCLPTAAAAAAAAPAYGDDSSSGYRDGSGSNVSAEKMCDRMYPRLQWSECRHRGKLCRCCKWQSKRGVDSSSAPDESLVAINKEAGSRSQSVVEGVRFSKDAERNSSHCSSEARGRQYFRRSNRSHWFRTGVGKSETGEKGGKKQSRLHSESGQKQTRSCPPSGSQQIRGVLLPLATLDRNNLYHQSEPPRSPRHAIAPPSKLEAPGLRYRQQGTLHKPENIVPSQKSFCKAAAVRRCARSNSPDNKLGLGSRRGRSLSIHSNPADPAQKEQDRSFVCSDNPGKAHVTKVAIDSILERIGDLERYLEHEISTERDLLTRCLHEFQKLSGNNSMEENIKYQGSEGGNGWGRRFSANKDEEKKYIKTHKSQEALQASKASEPEASAAHDDRPSRPGNPSKRESNHKEKGQSRRSMSRKILKEQKTYGQDVGNDQKNESHMSKRHRVVSEYECKDCQNMQRSGPNSRCLQCTSHHKDSAETSASSSASGAAWETECCSCESNASTMKKEEEGILRKICKSQAREKPVRINKKEEKTHYDEVKVSKMKGDHTVSQLSPLSPSVKSRPEPAAPVGASPRKNFEQARRSLLHMMIQKINSHLMAVSSLYNFDNKSSSQDVILENQYGKPDEAQACLKHLIKSIKPQLSNGTGDDGEINIIKDTTAKGEKIAARNSAKLDIADFDAPLLQDIGSEDKAIVSKEQGNVGAITPDLLNSPSWNQLVELNAQLDCPTSLGANFFDPLAEYQHHGRSASQRLLLSEAKLLNLPRDTDFSSPQQKPSRSVRCSPTRDKIGQMDSENQASETTQLIGVDVPENYVQNTSCTRPLDSQRNVYQHETGIPKYNHYSGSLLQSGARPCGERAHAVHYVGDHSRSQQPEVKAQDIMFEKAAEPNVQAGHGTWIPYPYLSEPHSQLQTSNYQHCLFHDDAPQTNLPQSPNQPLTISVQQRQYQYQQQQQQNLQQLQQHQLSKMQHLYNPLQRPFSDNFVERKQLLFQKPQQQLQLHPGLQQHLQTKAYQVDDFIERSGSKPAQLQVTHSCHDFQLMNSCPVEPLIPTSSNLAWLRHDVSSEATPAAATFAPVVASRSVQPCPGSCSRLSSPGPRRCSGLRSRSKIHCSSKTQTFGPLAPGMSIIEVNLVSEIIYGSRIFNDARTRPRLVLPVTDPNCVQLQHQARYNRQDKLPHQREAAHVNDVRADRQKMPVKHRAMSQGSCGRSKAENRTVCITNLPSHLEEIHLLKVLNEHGFVSKIYFIKHRNTGEFQGTAYVKFRQCAEAHSAVSALNKLVLEGQRVSASLMSKSMSKPLEEI